MVCFEAYKYLVTIYFNVNEVWKDMRAYIRE